MIDSTAPNLSSHRDVIALWPGLTEFASDIGTTYGNAKAMRRRNSIPDAYRAAVIEKAAMRGFVGVTFELLTLTAPTRARSAADAERVAL